MTNNVNFFAQKNVVFIRESVMKPECGMDVYVLEFKTVIIFYEWTKVPKQKKKKSACKEKCLLCLKQKGCIFERKAECAAHD